MANALTVLTLPMASSATAVALATCEKSYNDLVKTAFTYNINLLFFSIFYSVTKMLPNIYL